MGKVAFQDERVGEDKEAGERDEGVFTCQDRVVCQGEEGEYEEVEEEVLVGEGIFERGKLRPVELIAGPEVFDEARDRDMEVTVRVIE